MRRPFTGDTKIGACLPPFHTMGVDSFSTRSCVGNKMRQFMKERALHLIRSEFFQLRVELNFPLRPECPTSCRTHPGIPNNLHLIRQCFQTKASE